MKSEISKNSNAKGFVLDGFPRSSAAVEAFESEVYSRLMGVRRSILDYFRFQVSQISLVVYFEQSEDQLHDKIEQMTHQASDEDVESYADISKKLLEHFNLSQQQSVLEVTTFDLFTFLIIQKQ